MTSPPESDSHYAYFRAVGASDPSEITQLLGIEPTESWNVGDAFERRGHTFKRRSSMWQLESGCDDKRLLEDHIEALLQRLERYRNELLDICTRYRTQIVCVSYVHQSFSFELDFDSQRRATELGVGFWFDAYSFGDYHEEIVELREQLGIRREGDA